MINFEPIIIPNNRRQDGTYPVKIRVYYKGKCRRLPTTIVCYPSDLTRTKRKSIKMKKECTPREKAKELIKRMRVHTDSLTSYDLDGHDVDWVVQRIKDGLDKDNFQLDFFAWADKFVSQKAQGTRGAYTRSLNALERFLGKRTLDINRINKIMLLEFMEFVDKEPKMRYNKVTGEIVPSKSQRVPKAASSVIVMKLGHIFNAAKERFNDEDSDCIRIPKSPFKSIRKVFPTGDQAQGALSKDVIQQIISAETDSHKERIALDAFIVSFALMGANLADMYAAKPFQGGTWKYNRIKITSRKAEMRVDIPQEIMPHIQRLQDAGNTEFWLPRLRELGKNKDDCSRAIARHLRRWEDRVGLEDFTLYAARHSWSTIARSLGIDLASVNECLCHKDNLEMGRRYASLTWEQKNEINRKVINAFIW